MDDWLPDGLYPLARGSRLYADCIINYLEQHIEQRWHDYERMDIVLETYEMGSSLSFQFELVVCSRDSEARLGEYFRLGKVGVIR